MNGSSMIRGFSLEAEGRQADTSDPVVRTRRTKGCYMLLTHGPFARRACPAAAVEPQPATGSLHRRQERTAPPAHGLVGHGRCRAGGSALAGLSVAAALAVAAPCGAATYYVDFAGGSDRLSGLSPETAWKHAPGDSRAGPGPRAVRLQAGDSVLFRGGVAYRGTIVVRSAGTAAAPIRYVGDGWGAVPAVLDGAEPARQVRPCRSARDCGGAKDWAALHRMSLVSDQTVWEGLFQQDRPLALAEGDGPLPSGSARRMAGSRGRTVLIHAAPDLAPSFSTGAGRVGFLIVAGGHVEIRGFRASGFAPAHRFGPYAGVPVVQLQPLAGVSLAAMAGVGAVRHAPPVGPVIAGVTSGPV